MASQKPIGPIQKGAFTAWAKAHGMSVSQATSKVLAAKPGTYPPHVRRMANFSRNFGDN